MQYLGGKSKTRKQIAAFLESVRKPGQTYFEPFVGGAWVLQEMSGKRIAADGNVALIAMYKALQQGWVPPEFVSEAEYSSYMGEHSVADPMTAFVLFGCSFGGKWRGGYARSEGKTCYAATSRRSLLKQLPLIQSVQFKAGDFTKWRPKGQIVYCDPPYASTTNYGAFSGFNHDLFWQTMREWSRDNTVVVSEYAAPSDFKCVLEMSSRMGLRNSAVENELRTERLFMHKETR